jgi:hypothetical protein
MQTDYDEPMAGTLIQEPLLEEAPLTARDRCDRCRAQAYVRVKLRSGGSELLFCGHHWREHEPKILELAANVHDETSKLYDEAELYKTATTEV